MKLWLDDIRPAPEGFEWFTEPWKALRFILINKPVEWSLDHDLGLTQPTGYEFLCMIEELIMHGCDIKIPKQISVHSANPVGRARMEQVINQIRAFK